VEESDDCSFEFWTSTSVDSVGGKGFPDDVFANVGSYEEGDTGSETISFGEELIEEDDDERRGDELEDEEEAYSGSEGGGRPV
jgi:hypothetical protein